LLHVKLLSRHEVESRNAGLQHGAEVLFEIVTRGPQSLRHRFRESASQLVDRFSGHASLDTATVSKRPALKSRQSCRIPFTRSPRWSNRRFLCTASVPRACSFCASTAVLRHFCHWHACCKTGSAGAGPCSSSS